MHYPVACDFFTKDKISLFFMILLYDIHPRLNIKVEFNNARLSEWSEISPYALNQNNSCNIFTTLYFGLLLRHI